AQGVELPGVDAEDRAARQRLLDADVVSSDEVVDGRTVPVNDDVDRPGTSCEVISEVGAEACAMLRKSRCCRCQRYRDTQSTERSAAATRRTNSIDDEHYCSELPGDALSHRALEQRSRQVLI